MGESTVQRRKHDWRSRAEFLVSRGWESVPYYPKAGDETVVAHTSNPRQRWIRNGLYYVTEAALKIEQKQDTDACVKLAELLCQ